MCVGENCAVDPLTARREGHTGSAVSFQVKVKPLQQMTCPDIQRLEVNPLTTSGGLCVRLCLIR